MCTYAHHPVVVSTCTCCHLLLIWWIHILVCVVVSFVLSSLHHGVAHWNCIVFPGGERNCGVHELICVRKGRAGQNSGRLTSDAWPDTFTHTLIAVRSHSSVSACCAVSSLRYRHRVWPCFLFVFTPFCVVHQWTNNVCLLQRVTKWRECSCFTVLYCSFCISAWFN